MTTSERINKIANKRTRIDKEELDKKSAEQLNREQLTKEICDMGERIRAIIDVGNALLENDLLYKKGCSGKYIIPSDEAGYDRYNRLSPYGYSGSPVADGIYHKVGFIHDRRFLDSLDEKIQPIQFIGIEMGGACGEFNFLTDGVRVISESETKSQPVPVKHLEKFLKEFPLFESALYAWIDATM